jgi:hypothetical protein
MDVAQSQVTEFDYRLRWPARSLTALIVLLATWILTVVCLMIVGDRAMT